MVANIKKDFSECNFEAFVEGVKAGVADTNYKITPEETQAIIQAYFQKKQAEAQAEELKKSESIKADGLKFLEENKKKEGVVTTASGLQYIVMKEGTGKQPTATSNVTVHYHGTTPEGVVFDSSVERNQPASFGLNQVIKGWTEGVALMKEGAKYKFFIPQELAYGANPRPGGPIKPFMPLVFEVELFKIN
jgi:FKBP-type peptidyl-prolyl cis-trans isomerase